MADRFFFSPIAARRALPNRWDALALCLVIAVLVLVVQGSRGMTAPLSAPASADLTLDYSALPYYALRTTIRMFAAIACSLVFTFLYAPLAAKSRHAEIVLVPLLDVLQSVPVLGFLSFTVTFFLGLFPGSTLGAECAAVFAIFTSQAWNMAFSLFQSLRTVPRDLQEVARAFGLSAWQRFWQLETPFAMPGLVWNTMISMSGGWFFVVASEAISVGDTTIKLPGIGSYLALAIEQQRIDCVVAAVGTMALVILAYDVLLFRPIVAFSERFRVELTGGQPAVRSLVRTIFLRTRFLRALSRMPARLLQRVVFLRFDTGGVFTARPLRSRTAALVLNLAYGLICAAVGLYALWITVDYLASNLRAGDVVETVLLTLITMLRVLVLILLATLFWVPVGVWIGRRPRWAEKVQPLAQFLAAFPANVLFPVVVVAVVTYSLNPDIWLSFLIVFGTQWYIVFNVIAGASAFPRDLEEAAMNLHVRGLDWWQQVMLPGIFPYYVTGALTASGGSWNAAIVAEYVRWGDQTVVAHGIGAYIARATATGDYPRIVLGVTVMALFVILFNRLFWRPLFRFGERRLRLS